MDFSTKLIKLSCAGPPFEPLHHHQFLTWFGHLYSQEMRILRKIYGIFMGDPVSKSPKTIQILQIVRARKAQGKSPLAARVVFDWEHHHLLQRRLSPRVSLSNLGETGVKVLGEWVCLKMSCTPKNPMVLLIIIPTQNGYFIGGYTPFSDIPKWR